jgi:hypothetical protein
MPPVNPRENICTSGCVSATVGGLNVPRSTRSRNSRYARVTVATYSGFFLRPSILRQPTPASAIAFR